MHVNPVGNTKDIYVIKNDLNDKLYVGQAVNPKKRFSTHCAKGAIKNRNSLIDHIIAKYGKEHFYFEVLESNIENYNDREKYWIEHLNTRVPNGYNVMEGGQDPPGNRPVLTKSQVDLIIIELKTTKRSLGSIAKQFKTTKNVILGICTGESLIYRKDTEHYPLRNYSGKFTNEEIDEIVKLLKTTDIPIIEIAKKYGVNKKSIYLIRDGKTEMYKKQNEVYPLRPTSNNRPVLTNNEVVSIIDDIKNTSLPLKEIAEKYNVRQSTISEIVHGNSYKQSTETYPLR